MSLGPARSQVDLSHQGQDIPKVAGLEPGVLHHLQQQDRRGLGQGLSGMWVPSAMTVTSPCCCNGFAVITH